MLGGELALPRHRPRQSDHAGRPPDRHSGRRHRTDGLDPWTAAWLEHGVSYLARMGSSIEVNDADCRRELLFCLLGGHGVTYELSLSATEVLWQKGIFDGCERRGDRLQRYVQDLLGRAWYEPRRNTGGARRYRFPKRKAAVIRGADDWLRTHAAEELLRCLRAIADARGRRKWLCSCPGVGPKTATWVLRNIGLGEDLAILDVHILRALESSGRISEFRLPRDYEQVECAFLAWSAELGAPAPAFDLLLWELGRGEL